MKLEKGKFKVVYRSIKGECEVNYANTVAEVLVIVRMLHSNVPTHLGHCLAKLDVNEKIKIERFNHSKITIERI